MKRQNQKRLIRSRLLSGRNPLSLNDVRGSVSLLTAMTLPLMIAAVGLSVDASQWLFQRQHLQTVADVSSTAGLMIMSQGGKMADALATSADVAALNGQSAGIVRTVAGNDLNAATAQATLKVEGTATTIKVSLGQVVSKTFSQYFLPDSAQWISASATAGEGGSVSSNACILTLNANQTNFLNSGVTLNMPQCDYRTNSSVVINGQPNYIGLHAMLASGSINEGNSSFCSETTCKAGYAVAADPYQAVYGASINPIWQSTNVQPQNGEISPPPAGMAYNWSLNGGSYILDPGVYHINGDFNVNSGVNLTGYGVTIIPSGNINMDSNANITLTAPASGDTHGLLFASMSSNLNLNSGSNVHLIGSIYAPNASMYFNNGNTSEGTCLYIVAGMVTFNGNGMFHNSDCQAEGMVPIRDGGSIAALIK